MLEIEVEQSDEKASLKYVEVYVKDKNSASTSKKGTMSKLQMEKLN